jgi:hypothetical protein
MDDFNRAFYSMSAIVRRTFKVVLRCRSLLRGLVSFIANWGYRTSHIYHQRVYASRVEPPPLAGGPVTTSPLAAKTALLRPR